MPLKSIVEVFPYIDYSVYKPNTCLWFVANGRNFPRPEDFAKAVYTLDIGQNDIAAALQKVGEEDSKAVITDIVDHFGEQVKVSGWSYKTYL